MSRRTPIETTAVNEQEMKENSEEEFWHMEKMDTTPGFRYSDISTLALDSEFETNRSLASDFAKARVVQETSQLLKDGIKVQPNSHSFLQVTKRKTPVSFQLPTEQEPNFFGYQFCVVQGLRQSQFNSDTTIPSIIASAKQFGIFEMENHRYVKKIALDDEEKSIILLFRIKQVFQSKKTLRIPGPEASVGSFAYTTTLMLTYLLDSEAVQFRSDTRVLSVVRGAGEDMAENEARRFLLDSWVKSTFPGIPMVVILAKISQSTGPDQRKKWRTQQAFLILGSVPGFQIPEVIRRLGMKNCPDPVILAGFAFEFYLDTRSFLRHRYGSWRLLRGNPVVEISNVDLLQDTLVRDLRSIFPDSYFIYFTSEEGTDIAVISAPTPPDVDLLDLSRLNSTTHCTAQVKSHSLGHESMRELRAFYTLNDSFPSPWLKQGESPDSIIGLATPSSQTGEEWINPRPPRAQRVTPFKQTIQQNLVPMDTVTPSTPTYSVPLLAEFEQLKSAHVKLHEQVAELASLLRHIAADKGMLLDHTPGPPAVSATTCCDEYLETPKRKVLKSKPSDYITDSTPVLTQPSPQSSIQWIVNPEGSPRDIDEIGELHGNQQMDIGHSDTSLAQEEEAQFVAVLDAPASIPKISFKTSMIGGNNAPYASSILKASVLPTSDIWIYDQEDMPGVDVNPHRIQVKMSEDRALNSTLDQYCISIGKGAMATQLLTAGAKITCYGDHITSAQYDHLVNSGASTEYVFVDQSHSIFLDATKARARGDIASAINSPLHVWNFSSHCPAYANVKLRTHGKEFYYEVIRDIPPGSFLYANYRPEYRMHFRDQFGYQLSIPTCFLSPLVGVDRLHCLRRLQRLRTTGPSLYIINLANLDIFQSQSLDALMVSILRADHSTVIDLLKQTARFHCVYTGKITELLTINVMTEGLCFWDSIFWLSCNASGSPWTKDQSKRKPLLAAFIRQHIETINQQIELLVEFADIIGPALSAASRAAAFASGTVPDLPKEDWGRDTWFPMFARGLQSALWKQHDSNAGVQITVINEHRAPAFSFSELLSLNTSTSVLLRSEHFSPFTIRLHQEQLEQLVAALATALISSIND